MLTNGDIAFWCYIKHAADEDNKKAHIHLHIVPDRAIETASIINDLIEDDPNNVLPLKCRPFEFSKWDDWYLYCLHDQAYLKYKGLHRNLYYRPEDFISSDSDYLYDKVHSIDVSAYSGYDDLINAFKAGIGFDDLILQGKIPLNRAVQFATIWKSLKEGEIIKRHQEV